MKPRCPYCSKELEKAPTRKTKCPHCSQYIYVRRGKLLTEQQAQQADADARIEGWITILETLGASKKMYDDVHKKLSKRFGFEAPPRDTIWGMMNTLVSRQKSLLELERLYFLMGIFVKEEGKDPAPYIRKAMEVKETAIRQQVTEFGKRGLDLRIDTSGDEQVCSSCRKAASHTYTMSDFLKKMPIPGNCTSPNGCRCSIGSELPGRRK